MSLPPTAQPPTLPREPSTLWTAQELATFLRVSRRKVFSDLSRGAIPCLRLSNHAPRFSSCDIHLWLELGCPSAEEFHDRKRALSLTAKKECV